MSLTAANATILISVPGLFDVPQQLQQFAADEVYSTQSLKSAEVRMGVDGFLSGGFVYVEVVQGYTLQADSDSINIFDTWWASQQVAQDVFTASGLILLPTLGKKWTLRKGFLTDYQPLPEAKKLLEPQKFSITWERVIPALA